MATFLKSKTINHEGMKGEEDESKP